MWWSKDRSRMTGGAQALASPMMMYLEPRILFDGAVAATVADTAQPDAQPTAEAAGTPAAESHAAPGQADAMQADATQAAPGTAVLFVDSRVRDAASLLEGVAPGTQVVHLDATKDGLQQIADHLGTLQGISAVQIIAHGNAGDLWLGTSYLTAENIHARSEVLAQIGQGMNVGGDILLYGCYTAEGDRGLSLVESLAQSTGRDVAASDDRTGLGGDWDLEITVGNIESANVLSANAMSEYQWGLATWTATNNLNTGVGSLRAAIASAQSGDIVTFDANMTVSLTQVLVIDKNITIDGDLNNDNVADVTLDGQYRTQILHVTAGTTATLDGLVITRGMAAGNGANGGDSALVAQGGGIYNAGTLTLKNVTVTANAASGGGGGGGVTPQYAGGGGGGGGAITGGTGGKGGDTLNSTGTGGSAGQGGAGGGFFNMGGRGGSSTGGAGGAAYPGYSRGSVGGTAVSGALSIGGGGGGDGYNEIGGAGGGAVGGIFNDTGATLQIIGNSVISNNVGAGGGGGGGGAGGGNNHAGGAGGVGVGAIWNKGSILITAANFAALAGNVGGSGIGGSSAGMAGVSPASVSNVYADGGTIDTNFIPNAVPTIGNLHGDSVAWAGVGNTAVLDAGGNAALNDAELGALNGGNGDWAGASLAVQRAGTAVNTDTFGFDLSGALFTVTGNSLQSGGQTFATFINTNGVLSISFTSVGTPATTVLVNDVAQRITYRSDTPAGDATLRFTLSDGSASTTADVTVTSDTIYVTNTTDTATINVSNGVSFSEAVAIAAADVTGSQTLIFSSSFNSPMTLAGALAINESLTINGDAASGLTIAGSTISLGGGTTLNFTNASGTVTIASALAGSGSLSKAGEGTLVLSGSNSYAGTTSVNAGILLVNGALSGTSGTSVVSGATLGGDGSISSNVTVNSGGTLSPGTGGPGTMTVNGNLTMASGSTLAVEIDGTVAGTQYDRVIVNGTVDVSGATLSATHGYAPGDGDSYIIIVNDAADAVSGAFFGIAEGGSFLAGGNSTRLTASYVGGDGNDFTLTAPINIAPVIGNLHGDSVGYIEGASPTLLDSGSDASVSDSDSANFDGGNVTVAIVTNRVAGEDVLAIRNEGTDVGQMGVSGSTVSFGGVSIGTFVGGSGSSDLVISLNANSTPAAVQALLRNLTYANSNATDPSIDTRTVRVTVNDGDGGTSSNADIAVSVTAVNDAPTLSATGGTPTYTENGAAVDLFSAVSISTVEAGQSITGMTLTVSNLADGASEIFSVDGTNVALTNGVSGTTTGGNAIEYSVSVTGSTATVTLTKAGGLSSAAAQSVVDGMGYRNASEAPNTTSRVVTLTGISDSGGTSNGGVDTTAVSIAATVTVVSVNDAPVITSPASIGVTEDVAGALSGISFADVDAGSGTVSATFSVASGTLHAVSGSGVTVIGAGTGTLKLSGSIADINGFIAGDGLSFLTALNATTDVVLSVSIDDGGNTGIGGNLSDTDTVMLLVTAVNDAPVNAVPGAQTVDQDAALIFSSGNGNLISISDVDAGGGTVRVTLSASNALVTLPDTTGLSFTVGSGADDGTMTFEGSIAAINLALDGLIFSPTPGYHGAASLQIVTNDLGLSGSGGAQTDSDTIAISVNSITPEITSVNVSNPDGAYKVGDVVTVTLSFDRVVIVDTAGGSPTLLLETGATDRLATYVSGSGSDILTFSYTVQPGDVSADLDYQSTDALALNGASIRSATSVDAILTLPALGGADSIAGQHDLVIVGVTPSAVPVSADVPADPVHIAAQVPVVEVAYDDRVIVDTRASMPPPSALLPPLVPPSLFEVRSLGAGLPPLGNIFLHERALAPSFLSQVFASSGDGSFIGFVGFGGRDADVFGSSTLSSVFSGLVPQGAAVDIFDNDRDGMGDDEEDEEERRQGLLGAPTLAQQLDSLRSSELQQMDRLTRAFGEWVENAPVAETNTHHENTAQAAQA